MRPRPSRTPATRAPGRRGGFTLVELLVVLLIIMLLTAAMIPVVMPAINQSRVQGAASLVYGELTKAHDVAVRGNRPAGVRLVPDPIDPSRPAIVTASRLIAIESGPDYSEGQVGRYFSQAVPIPVGLPQYVVNGGNVPSEAQYPYLVLHEEKVELIPLGNGNSVPIPRTPTSWFYNIRQGDKIRLNDSGQVYTIAGPVTNPNIAYRPYGSVADPNGVVANYQNPAPNVERLINFGPPAIFTPSVPGNTQYEFLFLTNGQDDDGDGFIDEFDELFYHRNSDGSAGYFSPWNSTAPYPNEFELERFTRIPAGSTAVDYTISRRPVVSRGAREVTLPDETFVDLTSWNLTRERSRLPIDPYSGVVDILIAPNGQLVARDANANPAPLQSLPFYHLWLAERDDLFAPTHPPQPSSPNVPQPQNWLPMPREAIIANATSYPDSAPTLKGGRRLVSINARTGQVSTSTLEQFDPTDLELPYRNAQQGIKEQP